MTAIIVPAAPASYHQQEEQVFRDQVRRSIGLSASGESLHELSQRITSLPTYADDTAAGVGGLTAGQFYKTSAGAVMVKL